VNTVAPAISPRHKQLLTYSAWSVILIVSDLPDVISHALFGEVPGWFPWSKLGFLVVLSALCLCWKLLHPLLPYVSILLVFFVAVLIVPGLLNMGITLVVIVALWALKRRRSEFFLVMGDLGAPIGAVRWLGIGQGKSWGLFGWIFALAAAVTVPLAALLAMRPSADALVHAIPHLPAILFLAAVNAFNEEVWFRATLLSILPQVIGKSGALAIGAVFFGLAHYLYGIPRGLVGVPAGWRPEPIRAAGTRLRPRSQAGSEHFAPPLPQQHPISVMTPNDIQVQYVCQISEPYGSSHQSYTTAGKIGFAGGRWAHAK